MPTEAGRVTKRKRIPLGDSFVDIPVITQISFIDPNERYQEIQFTVDNSAQGTRRVHVVTLGAADDAETLQVERIDQWPVFDAADRGQETQHTLDNVTGEDASPYPHFTTHARTHYVTYKSATDSASIITELIDELVVFDPNDRGQDTHFFLTGNPPAGSYTLDPSDPDISDSGHGIDPPWRTDPFQNIVAFTTNPYPPEPDWYGTSCGLGPAPFSVVDIDWSPGRSVGDCRIFDSPANYPGLGNSGRPLSYHYCDWTVPDPLPPPPPQVVPWGAVQYSAGTLYKKHSEFTAAAATSRFHTGNIAWAFNANFGGPDSLATGALAPEINDYLESWNQGRIASAEINQYNPWIPLFRIFFVEDADWETWMGGIHDLVDPPDPPTA